MRYISKSYENIESALADFKCNLTPIHAYSRDREKGNKVSRQIVVEVEGNNLAEFEKVREVMGFH